MVNEYHLRTPLKDEDIKKLKVEDIVYISGILVTARDEAHEMALETLGKGQSLPIDMKGLALYHCGPVAKKINNTWRIIAAGPTTSMRMEGVEAEFIEKTGVKMIIGKGGMGEKTAESLKKNNAVYAVFTGGAGALAAERIKAVKEVYWLEELGIPEALWVFEVEEFGPLIITMDSYGNNYYKVRMDEIKERGERIKKEI
ncbi:MAG: FumA C-terminus/TtdB family hydratase beta subunit [Caldisphaeraceae archaeon]|nr:FumA C-terminus/TtdB family hydratase beta subunit [Caldisphaeraceae archaeon]